MISELVHTSLREKYKDVRSLTEHICEPLSPEDFIPQPAEFVSPAKWHLAHTSWFFEEFVLNPNLKGYQVFDKEFSFLFNSYYQHVGNRLFRSHRGALTRPSVERVFEYRTYVNQHMNDLLESELEDSVRAIINLGLNHEQQHQELLLTDLKFILGQNPTFPIYKNQLINDQNKERTMISIPEGIYEIGHKGKDFCFDNELGWHKVYLNEFEIDSGLVTNGEYLAFMESGGYKDFQWWLDEGWSWVKAEKVDSPMYWIKKDGKWFHFTLGGLMEIDPQDILCHVSFYEANAFASWKGMRLPTEFEWEIASDHVDWGKRWEWTNSAFLPYPGFTKDEGAIGEYNGKFMVNQMVLRGSSVATSPGHSRNTYRNFFHPHFQWQFSGIRLAK